jgi:putative nucleotidyltransferase with HDIG domain
LNDHHLVFLQQHGIELWKEDTQLVTEFITEEAVAELKCIFAKIRNHPEQLANDLIQHGMMPVIQKLSSDMNFLSVILQLCQKDHFTYRHSIGVAMISFLIGKWLGKKDEELNELAIAGLLHDIGKMKIPDSILKKAGKLSADEYAEMKLHTHFGYEMIRELPGMTEEQALVALQHHEREDGSGYPFGIFGQQITCFSKIVAVADVFHTMISERVYKKAVPLFRALEEIHRCAAFGLFNPLIVHTFITNLMNRLVGDLVLLTNGQIARIVMIHPDDLIHPLVESHGQFYDLRYSEHQIIDFASEPLR